MIFLNLSQIFYITKYQKINIFNLIIISYNQNIIFSLQELSCRLVTETRSIAVMWYFRWILMSSQINSHLKIKALNRAFRDDSNHDSYKCLHGIQVYLCFY